MKRILTSRDLERLEAEILQDLAQDASPHTKYQTRPLDWIVEKLGVPRHTLAWSENEGYEAHEWDGTPDPLVAILEGLAAGEDAGCESGRGVGKTFLAACVVLWFLACWEDSLVITIAPKREMLLKQCWREIQRLFPRFQRHFPSAESTQGVIRMRGGTDESWSAHAYGAGVAADEQLAVRAQGWHAEHMLVLFEETPGIHPAIMATIDHTVTGEHNPRLALGNPVFKGDTLHQFSLRPSTRHVIASAVDAPNYVTGREIVPGAVGRASVERRLEDWAHAPAVIEASIYGRSPDQAHGAVFRVPDEAIVDMTDEEIRKGIESGWHVLLGIDYGANTFAAVIGVLDADGRVTIVREYMSHREDMDTRMDGTRKGKIKGVRNTESGYVEGGIDKVNTAFARGELRIAASLASDWRKGVRGPSPGRPVEGESRLRWELANLQWDERRPDAPDKDTADGAHMTDALRYLIMGKLERYRARTPGERLDRMRKAVTVAEDLAYPVPLRTLRDLPPDRDGNRDLGLERLSAIKWQMDLQRYPRFRPYYLKTLEKKRAERERTREAKATKRRERLDARHAEVAKRERLRDVGEALEAAVERSGLSVDEAVDRILGIAEGE